MDDRVLVQVCLLGEALSTAWERAHEGSFTSMDSQVVEEIMPLSKIHSTIIMIALQDLNEPLGPRVLVFEHSEFTCFGYSFFDLDLGEVEALPALDLNFGTLRDLSPNCGIVDLIFCEALMEGLQLQTAAGTGY